jgi:hypothetical protein
MLSGPGPPKEMFSQAVFRNNDRMRGGSAQLYLHSFALYPIEEKVEALMI